MTFRLTILALTILAFTTKSDKVVIGKIYSSENPQFYNVENILVILRCDNKPFDSVWTNDKGEFSAIIPSGKQKGIDILYSGIGFGTIYLKHLEQISADTTNLKIDIVNTYKRNIFGKAICPRCNKSNRVYKIRYGDAPIYTFKINAHGDTTYSPSQWSLSGRNVCIKCSKCKLVLRQR